jgi:hypothetical protein
MLGVNPLDFAVELTPVKGQTYLVPRFRLRSFAEKFSFRIPAQAVTSTQDRQGRQGFELGSVSPEPLVVQSRPRSNGGVESAAEVFQLGLGFTDLSVDPKRLQAAGRAFEPRSQLTNLFFQGSSSIRRRVIEFLGQHLKGVAHC